MEIKHIKEDCTFELVIDNTRAFVTYEIYDGGLDIRKTLVPEALAGQGLASKLVKAAYDYAREQNLKCIATCSYAVKWLERHPEYRVRKAQIMLKAAAPLVSIRHKRSQHFS